MKNKYRTGWKTRKAAKYAQKRWGINEVPTVVLGWAFVMDKDGNAHEWRVK